MSDEGIDERQQGKNSEAQGWIDAHLVVFGIDGNADAISRLIEEVGKNF